MADGCHFENCYIFISPPRIVRNFVCGRKFWPNRRKCEKNSEIPKIKMADGRHIQNHFFLAITRLHIVQLRRNLEWGGTIARVRRLDDENVKFRKSNMADGRQFENRYSSIIISAANRPNLTKSGTQTQILSKATETWQKFRNSQIQDGGRTPYWKSFFGYNSAPYSPIKTKFGMTRHNQSHAHEGSMMKIQISKIQHGGRPPFWKIIISPYLSRKLSEFHET